MNVVAFTKIGTAACLLALAPAAARAQQPNRQPPPTCDAPEYRQFDFWVGEWEVMNPAGTKLGTNRITRMLKDCVIHEDWTDAGGSRGQSFNIWSRQDRKWHQSWVSDTGAHLLLTGELQGQAMVMEGETRARDGRTVHNRITWSLIDGNKDRLRQHWERSTDGGKTWTTAFDGIYVRRK